MNTFKQWVAKLGYALISWAQKPAYVVIYDDSKKDPLDDAAEQYYGFFNSPDDAIDGFNRLQTRSYQYMDARLCLVMGAVEDEPSETSNLIKTLKKHERFIAQSNGKAGAEDEGEK